MAPEVVNSLAYNHKCDLWSIGIVLYVILSGKFPFYSESTDETIKKINKQELDLESNYNKYYRSSMEENFKRSKKLFKEIIAT